MIAKRFACTISAAVLLLIAADGPKPGRPAPTRRR